MQLVTDAGTENSLIGPLHMLLSRGPADPSGQESISIVPSTYNTRIESRREGAVVVEISVCAVTQVVQSAQIHGTVVDHAPR